MNRITIAVLSIASLLLLATKHVASDDSSNSHSKKVDKLFAKWNKPGSPGCAVGIIRNGKFVHKRGYGTANLDHDVPITSKSVFEIGSASKAFTCACIALLLDKGKIAADDDVRKYLPELPRYKKPILIKHLIQCRSGLPDYFHLTRLAGWEIEDAYTDGDVLALLTRWKSLPFTPGEKYKYGSSDAFLLGQIVKRVTGQTLGEFAKANLFKPLGMTNTFFDENPSEVVKGRAVGYQPKPNGGFRRWLRHSGAIGGWGVWTCIEDMYRWNQNFERNQLSHGKHLKELLTNGTLLENQKVLEGTESDYYRGLRRIRFTGGMPGFLAVMVRFPKQSFSVIILTNTSEINPFENAWKIADLYLGDEFKQEKATKLKNPKKYKFIKLTSKQLQDKVGTYRRKSGPIDGFIEKIEMKKGKLYLTNHFNHSIELAPITVTWFRENSPKGAADYRFQRQDKDKLFDLMVVGDAGWKGWLERIKLANPTPKDLSAYAGNYYNDELLTTYRFSVAKGSLWLQMNNHRKERLFGTIKDEFVPAVRTVDDGEIIRFDRNEKGSVVGLRIDLWRVKNVFFRRVR